MFYKQSAICKFKQSGNSIDTDQLSSKKPADLDLHCFSDEVLL